MQTNITSHSLPTGWAWTTLENCIEILDSQRIPINADEREQRIVGKSKNGLIPYYGATGQVGWIDDYIFDEELVLVGEDGAPFLEANKSKAYIIRGKSWVNNHAHVLRAVLGLTINQFVCHYLNQFDYHSYVTGTTRLKLPQSPLRKIPIPIPPLPEQRRIVAKIEELFTKLDAGVEALKKVKAELKRYRQSVLKYAFEGRITAEWRQSQISRQEDGGQANPKSQIPIESGSILLERIREEKRKALGKKYKELSSLDTSSFQSLPEGWAWVTVEDLISHRENSVKRGPFGSAIKKSFFVPKGYKVYEQQNAIYDEHTLGSYFISGKKFEELKGFAVGPGDFIISCSGTIGRVSRLPNNAPVGVINQALLKMTIDERLISPKFFLHLFRSEGFQRKVAKETRGSAMKNISSVEDIKAIPVVLPPLRQQDEIVAEIERRFSVADQIEHVVGQSLKQAERLRQSILKKAFEGKLVEQDPSDPPASTLLEQIRMAKEQQEMETATRAKKSRIPRRTPAGR